MSKPLHKDNYFSESKDINKRVEILERMVRILSIFTEDSGWFKPTILNSWEYYGSSTTIPKYKLQGSIVRFQGTFKNGVSGTEIFNLPSNFRPQEQINCVGSMETTGGVFTGCYVRILPSGSVAIFYAGTLSFCSVDGVTFSIK